ncbi:MAG: HD domain-containing protein [Treponema sp.]|nr:HD domain-containing protein [Treponema sp.]
MDNREQANEILECLYEISTLTKFPRTGWILAGVRDPESVSDHCFETALLAYMLSRKIDYRFDIGKMMTMALFHEIGETRLTDMPRRAKPYIKEFKKKAEKSILFDVMGSFAENVNSILSEFEEKETPEAKLVEAAEELQIIFRSLLYAKENNGDMSEYREDVAKYSSEGFDIAQDIAAVIGEKLDKYLNGKEYWEIGYKRQGGK